jgi:HK97 gp10 family phage protein
MQRVVGVDKVIKTLEKLGSEYPKEFIARATHELHDNAIKNASKHTKTGRLENNIEMGVRGNSGEVYIANGGMAKKWRGKYVNYGIFVHFGSNPHIIKPKHKKALRWGGSSAFHFAKSVNHPGYKGDPFMYNALEKTRKRLNQIAKETIDGI